MAPKLSPGAGIYRVILCLSPVAAIPAVAAIGMIPVTAFPVAASAGMAPVAVAPGISSAGPDPVPVNPDIIGAGSCGPCINNFRRLGLHIAIHGTAGGAEGGYYCYDY